MELTVVGCDGSWPGPGGTGSCYLVQHGGFSLVIDLGGGALGRLQEHIAIAEIGGIAISHAHPDHYTDLLPLSIAMHWGALASSSVPLYVPEGFSSHVSGALMPGTREAWDEAFELSQLLDGAEREIGPFLLKASSIPHTEASLGFRISVGEKTLAYTGDTGPGEIVAELARGADLLLSEATHVDGDELEFHLTARQAAAYAKQAGVDRLVLTHLEPGVDPATSLEQAREAFEGEVTVASPGLRFAI